MVGDTEQVTLTSGFKSAPVTFNWAVGSNGGNNVPGPSPGATDTSGNYTFSAEVGPGLNGNWTETWFVGGVPAAQTSFSVVSLPVITGPSGSTSVSFWYLGGAATCCIDTTPANTFPTTMSVSLAVNTPIRRRRLFGTRTARQEFKSPRAEPQAQLSRRSLGRSSQCRGDRGTLRCVPCRRRSAGCTKSCRRTVGRPNSALKGNRSNARGIRSLRLCGCRPAEPSSFRARHYAGQPASRYLRRGHAVVDTRRVPVAHGPRNPDDGEQRAVSCLKGQRHA